MKPPTLPELKALVQFWQGWELILADHTEDCPANREMLRNLRATLRILRWMIAQDESTERVLRRLEHMAGRDKKGKR